VGIPTDELERFRKEKPKPGRTADTVMRQGYVAVKDISQPEYDFLGQSTRDLLNRIGVQSFQGIALQVGDENLGVLYVNYNRPQVFGEEDKRTLETFANHAALSFKKARLLDQVNKARDTAKVVAEVSVLEDLEQTLCSIVKGTKDVLGCDAVSLYTYDQVADKLGYPPSMTGVWYPERATRLPEVPSDSIVFKMLKRDEPYIVDNTSTDSHFRNLRFVMDEQVKSCATMPLKVGDRKVGVIFVNYRSLHRFTSEELTNIELFAHQAAVAIRNAQLYESERKRANALQALYEASQAVTGTLKLDEILDRIVEQVWQVIARLGEQTHISHLGLRDGRRIKFIAAYPPRELTKLRAEIDLETDVPIGITGRAVLTGQTQLVENVLDGADYIETHPRIRSLLSVPIQIGGRVIGVITVEHPETSAFDEEDQRALESLAAQAAVAIESARLYEMQQQRAKQLALINQVAAEISSTLDLEQILQTLVNELAQVIRVEQCAIAIFEERGEYGDVVAEYLEEGCVPSKGIRIPLRDNAAVELVRKTKRPLAVKDAQQDPIMEKVWGIMKQRRTQSIMIVPIVIGDRVIGTIGLDAVSGPREFTEEEKWLAETISYHASIAIQNARRYEDLEKTKGELAAAEAVAWMGILGSSWSHGVNQKSFAIRNYVEVLRALVPSEPEVEDVLSKTEAAADDIKNIPITQPLPTTPGTSHGVVEIDDALRKQVQKWCRPRQDIHVQFDLHCPHVQAQIDREWLEVALEKLVSNALKAMADGGTLTVSSERVGDMVRICLADTGHGIPDYAREHFLKDRIPKEDGSGTGVGVLIAQLIFRRYGGELSLLWTEPGRGTALEILLPVEKAQAPRREQHGIQGGR